MPAPAPPPPHLPAEVASSLAPEQGPPSDMGEALPASHAPLAERAILVRVPIAWDRVGWGSALAVFVYVALWLAYAIRPVSVPVLVALALAYILNPAVEWLCRFRLPRTLAIASLLASFALLGASLVVLLGPQVINEVREVPSKLRQVLAVIRPHIEHIFDIELPDSLDKVLLTLQAALADHEQTPFAAIAQKATAAARVIFGSTVTALTSLGFFALIPLFCFYFLRDFQRLAFGAYVLCPVRWQPQLAEMWREIDAMLGSFVRGQIIVGLVLAVLYSVGFYLAGLPLALLVGLITGLGNMLPFVGTAIGLSLSLLFCLLSWHGFGQPLAVLGVFAVNHALESWLITPRVVGTSVGLPPVLVIMSVLVFGELFGFLGVLVAVPLTAILKILGRNALHRYRRSMFYTCR